MNIEKRGCPNLFNFATSELSQDAFIAWLAEWASPEFAQVDPGMHEQGRRFLEALVGPVGVQRGLDGHVCVVMQRGRIDVCIEVGDHTLVAIEDKTAGQLRHRQDERVEAAANKDVNAAGEPWKHIYLVYCKTGSDAVNEGPDKLRWRRFRRSDFLDVLDPNHANALVREFREHLERMDDEIACFIETPIDQWNSGYSYDGFFTLLETKLTEQGEACFGNQYSSVGRSYKSLRWHRQRYLKSDREVFLEVDGHGLHVRMLCGERPVLEPERDAMFEQFRQCFEEVEWLIAKPIRGFNPGRTVGIARIFHEGAKRFPRVDGAGKVDLQASMWMLEVVQGAVADFCAGRRRF